MDILYQLPFPHDVCSKIFMYACKSPHTGLGGAMLKKIVGLPFYKEYCINKIGKEFGVNYYKRNVVELNSCHWCNEKKANFDIGYLYMLPNLIWLYLVNTSVYGDIVHLNSLTNLIIIDLSHTNVSGDIIHFKSLYNLTDIILNDTGVNGNIAHLNSLPDLELIDLENTDVNGNIAHLNSLLNLQVINLGNTDVTGDILNIKSLPDLDAIRIENTSINVDEDKFHKYRERAGLDKCEISLD